MEKLCHRIYLGLIAPREEFLDKERLMWCPEDQSEEFFREKKMLWVDFLNFESKIFDPGTSRICRFEAIMMVVKVEGVMKYDSSVTHGFKPGTGMGKA